LEAVLKKPTVDSDGRYNGYLIPIWNALERPDLRPDQIYLTAVAPHSRKGPHLHRKRRGLFCCVKGDVAIRIRDADGSYRIELTGALLGYGHLVEVPAGTPCALYNDTDEVALVLNMPAPAWSREDPDEWPVEGWID
jgi:dTDP-4-dehydrorhamnose 3,5-epimerase-like enzyme